MIYGVLQVDIRIFSTNSLKNKRSVLRKITERVRNAYSISIAEVGDHDMLGNATLGIALAGSDAVQVENVLQGVLKIMDENPEIDIYDSVILVDQLK